MALTARAAATAKRPITVLFYRLRSRLAHLARGTLPHTRARESGLQSPLMLRRNSVSDTPVSADSRSSASADAGSRLLTFARRISSSSFTLVECRSPASRNIREHRRRRCSPHLRRERSRELRFGCYEEGGQSALGR